ncbi:MAG TPA: hypothetical protein VFS30_07460, partial [Dehalococcoidia bacterium]|nr:hypothetical protein [Dehalococcoidia bacterium]
MNETPKRILVTGGPGAGKSRLALTLSRRLGLPYIDTDAISLDLQAELPLPLDFEALMARRLPLSAELASGEAWIVDGSNLSASLPFYERADSICYLSCRWRVAAYRILLRHAKLSV